MRKLVDPGGSRAVVHDASPVYGIGHWIPEHIPASAHADRTFIARIGT